MCVKVLITLLSEKAYFGQIEKEVESRVGTELHLESESVSSRPLTFSISEPGAGCGCSLVVDTADWAESAWRFKPEKVSVIEESVAAIAALARNDFRFSVAWLGPDRPDACEKTISLHDLLAAIRESRIVPGCEYQVAAV